VYSAFPGYNVPGAGLNYIERELNRKGIPTARIDGEVTEPNRIQAVNEYNNGSKRVMLLSHAGALGLDFKLTSAIVILEPPWHPADVYQIIGRGVRFGSHDSVPVADRKVDAYLLRSNPLTDEFRKGPYLTDKKIYDKFVWEKQKIIVDTFAALAPYSVDGGKHFVPTFPTRARHVVRRANLKN